MSKYFDFDQFREENKKEPVVIKIFGKEEELPPALPAGIYVRSNVQNWSIINSRGDQYSYSNIWCR